MPRAERDKDACKEIKVTLSERRKRMLEIYRTQNYRRQKFLKNLKEYGGNIEVALIKAGYSVRSVKTQMAAVNNDPILAEYMSLMEEELLDKLLGEKAATVNEIKLLAFSNMKDYYDGKGKLIPIDDLTREQAAAIEKIVYDKDTGNPIRFELSSKRLSLQLYAQIQQLLTVTDTAQDDKSVMDKLNDARKRIKPPNSVALNKDTA